MSYVMKNPMMGRSVMVAASCMIGIIQVPQLFLRHIDDRAFYDAFSVV
jgi:hypothetical protein